MLTVDATQLTHQPFTWKAAGLFIVTGAALYYYFTEEKKKVLERRR